MYAKGYPPFQKCVACIQNIKEGSVKVLVNKTSEILGDCYKCSLRVWWVTKWEQTGLSNGLTLTAEWDLWKEIALMKELSLLLVNSWCTTEWCGSAGSLLYRKGGDPQPWGCTPSVTNRARPDTAHSSGVLWGFSMGRGTGFLIPSPAWQKCPVASRFAKNVGVNQVRHNYWKRGAYQIQPQGAGLAILSWLLFWNHFSYGFLWFVGFFLFVISASVPIPLPWHETCQGHNFSPSPLQSVSLAPNFWSTAISTTWSILFSHFMGLFGLFLSQNT